MIIGAGLAITGVLMLVVLGPQLITQPWLMLALVIYATNLGLAFFVQRPGLRRLLGMHGKPTDEEFTRKKQMVAFQHAFVGASRRRIASPPSPCRVENGASTRPCTRPSLALIRRRWSIA
jgi:hypothetical protein